MPLEDAQLACSIMLAHEQHGIQKVITFHHTVLLPLPAAAAMALRVMFQIKIAKRFADSLQKLFRALEQHVTPLHVNGNMHQNVSSSVLRKFQQSQGLTVLTNAKVHSHAL